MGPPSLPEKRVGAVFALTAAAWLCRPLLETVRPAMSDTSIPIASALLLFSGGQLRIGQMIRAGVALSLFSVLRIALVCFMLVRRIW